MRVGGCLSASHPQVEWKGRSVVYQATAAA